jgi:sec-independent protein translocase protein TatA
MADSFIPDRAAGAAPARATEFDRLYRLIEGLLDADILLPEEGGALLEAIDRAHRCHREGDREAAHRHWLRLGLAIESLVENGRLEAAHGRAAIALVRQTPSREEGDAMIPHFGAQELLIVLALVLVLFGAKKVPEMARGLGQGLKEFRHAAREASLDEEVAPTSTGGDPA